MDELTKARLKFYWLVIKRVFKPTLLKLSLAVFLLAINFMILGDIFASIRVVPCHMQKDIGGEYLTTDCALNPLIHLEHDESTVYFYSDTLDSIYQMSYLLIMTLLIPYFLSCMMLSVYDYYMPKN